MENLLKTNRGGYNIDQLVRNFGMVDPSGNNAGMYDFFESLMRNVGMNHIVQVNDCETSGDWSESDDGTFDYAVAATGKRVGTNCLKLTGTAACDNTQYVQTLYVDESEQQGSFIGDTKGLDWNDSKYLGFWLHTTSSGDFGTEGELKVALYYEDGTISEKQDVPATVGTAHIWAQIDISDLERDNVAGLRFYCNNANTGEFVYIDDIIRYRVSYNGAPLYGAYLPIKSGTTLANKDTITWSIDGAIKASSAAAVTDLGAGYLTETVTGTAKRNKSINIPGVYICLVQAGAATVAGENLIWKSNGKYEGGATGVDEVGMYKGLEAAGADGDYIFAVKTFGGNFIS